MRFILFFLGLVGVVCGQSFGEFGFEPNLGQYPAAVRFVHRGSSTFYLTRDAMVLSGELRVQIADVDAKVVPEGVLPLSTVHNAYQGNESSKWRTNTRLFGAVRLSEIYPGVSANFGVSTQVINPYTGFAVGLGKISLSAAAGADLGRFRLKVLNTGVVPSGGPGGVIYVGGRIPGVFAVGLRIVQLDGVQRVSLDGGFKIESGESLSIFVNGLNPALATEVEIAFPNFENSNRSPELPTRAADGNRYRWGGVEAPRFSMEDGGAVGTQCRYGCSEAFVARLDEGGKQVWLTMLGGALEDFASVLDVVEGGVVIAGGSSSQDFPVSANAPFARLTSNSDLFFALLDRENGQLKTATFAGLGGRAWALTQAVDLKRDLVIGGGYQREVPSDAPAQGYVTRWQAAENRFTFLRELEGPVENLKMDGKSRIFYVAQAQGRMNTGILDAGGKPEGKPIQVEAPLGWANARLGGTKIVLTSGVEYFIAYQTSTAEQIYSYPELRLVKVSPAEGRLTLKRRLAAAGTIVEAEVTPTGNLKFLLQNTSSTEETTVNAQLVAACDATSYFLIAGQDGRTIQATYVPTVGFDFRKQNEFAGVPVAKASCMAASAGRRPTSFLTPGQLVTITGGGFGPDSPVYTSPGSDGKYPTVAYGFRVLVAGISAPIIAVAKGLVAVQVPFEVGVNSVDLSIEVIENNVVVNALEARSIPQQISLFDTSDRNNELHLPALAALNQNGTVNSRENPASPGSIISVFGSGLGVLSPALVSGGLNPVPPAGELSKFGFLKHAWGGTVLYLGSAPGLSTAVVQANIQLPDSIPGNGVRGYGIGVVAGQRSGELFLAAPSGVVFVK